MTPSPGRAAVFVFLAIALLLLVGCRLQQVADNGRDQLPTAAAVPPTITPPATATATEAAEPVVVKDTPTRHVTATATAVPTMAATTPTPVVETQPESTATSSVADGAGNDPPTGTPVSTPTQPLIFATATPGAHVGNFTVQPLSVTPGDSVTVSWEATGEQVELCLLVPFQSSLVARTCESVPTEGTLNYPIDPIYRNEVVLQLRVTAGGSGTEASAHISLPCPDDWWFFANPPATCPALDPRHEPAAAQQFERGTMVWLSESGIYYIFYDEPGRPYTMVYDPLNITGTEGTPPEEPPPGLYAPVSGFGLLWRGEVAGVEAQWDRLGWAVAPEFNYEAITQPEAADQLARLFLRSPVGQTLALQPGTYSWSLWTGP